MGKIVIATNMTLDGVVQDPDGKEDWDRGGWFRERGGDDLDAWTEILTQEAGRAQALLLGRRTDAWFAARWSARTGAWADRLNSLPKYVVSSTLEKTAWQNGSVLRGHLADEAKALKEKVPGDIVVYASYQLGQALMDLDLVDEVRLFLFPAVLGAGKPLFGPTRATRAFRLAETRKLGERLVYLIYVREERKDAAMKSV